ncbi:ABC transporter ATP-binding protein [Burkholderia sp. PU8-34]
MPLLSLKNINLRFKRFEGTAHILHDLNLEVHAHEHVAVVGESGCGKSLTLRVILGLIDGRDARIDGDVVFNDRILRRKDFPSVRGRDIAMIFQDPMASLNPTFTVGDQLRAVARRSRSFASRRALDKLCADSLRQVAIDDPERILAAYPFQLSGGLCQRVLITMALLNEPKLILADEPGTALDVTVQRQTMNLLSRRVDDTGAAVLLITHNLGVVREFAHRVYVMYGGTIVEQGSTADIFNNARHPYTRALLASVPRLTGDGLPVGIDGSVPDYLAPPSGCRFMPRCPHATAACAKPVAESVVGDGHTVRCVLFQHSQEACHA